MPSSPGSEMWVKRDGRSRRAVRVLPYAPVGGRRSPRKDFGVCTTWAPAARKGRLNQIAVAALVGDARRRDGKAAFGLVSLMRPGGKRGRVRVYALTWQSETRIVNLANNVLPLKVTNSGNCAT